MAQFPASWLLGCPTSVLTCVFFLFPLPSLPQRVNKKGLQTAGCGLCFAAASCPGLFSPFGDGESSGQEFALCHTQSGDPTVPQEPVVSGPVAVGLTKQIPVAKVHPVLLSRASSPHTPWSEPPDPWSMLVPGPIAT